MIMTSYVIEVKKPDLKLLDFSSIEVQNLSFDEDTINMACKLIAYVLQKHILETEDVYYETTCIC